MAYRLTPTGPYSLSLSLKRLQDLPHQVIGRVEEGPSYVRALAQCERVGLVRVWAEGADLLVAIEGELEPEPTLAAVRRAFQLDLDLAGFWAHLNQADPVLAGLVRTYPGARPISPFSPWESLAWAIIGQQINISFAFSLKATLVRLGGQGYGGYPAFPTPERVASLPYEALQAEKYSRRKAEYLIDIARAIAEGRLDLEAILAQPYEEAVAQLVRLRGVGRWTADCLLMDFGHGEAFPAADIGLRNAVQRLYGLERQPTEAQVREIGKAWAPQTALASFYLWLGLLDKG